MRFAKPLLAAFFIITGIVLGFVFWANSVMGPAPEAFAGLRSDAQVTVGLDEFLVFQPASKKPSIGLIFYPGGRVDYRSYAVPLHRIAEEGYLVIVLPLRFNLGVLDVNAADRAIAAFPSIRHWVVGGHSLGGVASALYASQHQDVAGLMLWASYPSNDSLKNTSLKVISIYGTKDMNGEVAFEDARALLPVDAQYVVIQGGNHAQFGDYGVQPGDNEATITRLEQQKQVVDATIRFLKELSQ